MHQHISTCILYKGDILLAAVRQELQNLQVAKTTAEAELQRPPAVHL